MYMLSYAVTSLRSERERKFGWWRGDHGAVLADCFLMLTCLDFFDPEDGSSIF
jgi:hypothetical protein